MNWYALYTKPKREDTVAFRLRDIGIEVLNPKLKSRRYKQSKVIGTIEPLFPCYLLAKFDKGKYSHIITYTRGVRYIVGKSNPVAIHEEIIQTIKEKMEEGDTVVIKPCRFEKGDRVIIKDGHFKDLYGIFERETKGRERIIIFLNTINYRIELDSWLLRKV